MFEPKFKDMKTNDCAQIVKILSAAQFPNEIFYFLKKIEDIVV